MEVIGLGICLLYSFAVGYYCINKTLFGYKKHKFMQNNRHIKKTVIKKLCFITILTQICSKII